MAPRTGARVEGSPANTPTCGRAPPLALPLPGGREVLLLLLLLGLRLAVLLLLPGQGLQIAFWVLPEGGDTASDYWRVEEGPRLPVQSGVQGGPHQATGHQVAPCATPAPGATPASET